MIFVDTSAILTYLIYFFAKRRDGRAVLVQRSNRGPTAAAFDDAIESGELAITGTAAAEAARSARRAITSAAKAAGATVYSLDEVVEDVLSKLGRLVSRFSVKDRDEYAKEAGRVYADAWADERMRDAIAIRQIIKEGSGKDASMPTPEKNRGDFMILSTAAYWAARGHDVQLLTFDQDFAAFTIAIREKLGVDIVDCGRLGRQ